LTFGKKKLYEILTRDVIVLVFAFTIVAVLLSSLFIVDFAEASHRTTPIVSTRNHFWPYGVLNWWHTPTDYVASDIPGCSPAREIVIHTHGWGITEEQAIDRFNVVKKSLNSLGYTQPIIGFTWDADLFWNNAVNAAEENGHKLAQFILDYKIACEHANIRLVGHSLGARVVLNALDSLYDNEIWTERGYKVASVHLMGAAVNPIEVSTVYFGTSIRNVADEFHNKFSPQDDMLEGFYYSVHRHRALGEVGALNIGIPLSPNYEEEDVAIEISRDTDGDGDLDLDNLGDHHSGYIGVARNGNVTSNGAMDILVGDWQEN
jgi:Protein of unknown function (DUF726)